MKDLKECLITEKIADEEIIVLAPDELEKILEYVKGKEDKGLCIRYTWNDDDEWHKFEVCRFDERGTDGNGPRNWPWKKIIYNQQ